MEKIKQNFKKLFSEEPSEGYPEYECTIDTKPGKSVYIKYRSILNAFLKGTEKTISHLVKNGFIELSQSSWANPIRPVKKPNGEVRITSNMQFLNNLVEDDNYTVQNIQRIIKNTQGQKVFTVIDLKDRYFQIRLHKFKTAFYFNNKSYINGLECLETSKIGLQFFKES